MALSLNYKDFVFLSSNGSFFTLPLTSYSRFFGLFTLYNNKFIKILDRIVNLDIKEEPREIFLRGSNEVIIKYDSFYERYYLFQHGILYEVPFTSKIELYFDVKDIYDTEEWNRIYGYEVLPDYILLRFSKGDLNVKLYIYGFSNIEENENKWIKVRYNYDERRKSPPFERYLYSPFKLTGRSIYIGLRRRLEGEYINPNCSIKEIVKDRISSFIHNWISAGYPWYPQEWSRDVLISLRGLYIIGYKKIVKDKLIEYLSYILPNGKIKNIVHNGINGNSDSFGWYVKRLFEFKYLFTMEEFAKIVNKIEENLVKFTETHYDSKTKLFIAFPNESWMDTLNRKHPIELQFLILNIYKNLYEYKRDERYRELYLDLLNTVKNTYLEDNSLLDSPDSRKIRPNVFLSYYILPDVFNREKWEKIFDYTLNHLWLEWGGLSSLSKLDKEFVEENNGDNYFRDIGKSMHNGDSWIFLNHIAAICMKRVNKEKYKKYIGKILLSSIKYLKEIGTLPELSSAKKRDISGAISQLWSLSTFVELLKELKIGWDKIEEILYRL